MRKKQEEKIVSKPIQVDEKTYQSIIELSLFSGVKIYKLVEFAWNEFSKSKEYAVLKLLGKEKEEK